MAMDRAALLRQIAESTSSGGGNYIRDSRGRLCVKRIAFEEGFGGNRAVAEFVVVSSAKIDVFALTNKDGQTIGAKLDIEPYGVGAEVNELFQFGDPKKDPGFGKFKALVLALYGVSPTGTTPDEIISTMDTLDKTNGARGMLIDYSTRRIITTGKGIEITVTDFTNVPGTGPDGAQTDEQMDQYIAWMDSLRATPTTPNVAGGAPASA